MSTNPRAEWRTLRIILNHKNADGQPYAAVFTPEGHEVARPVNSTIHISEVAGGLYEVSFTTLVDASCIGIAE